MREITGISLSRAMRATLLVGTALSAASVSAQDNSGTGPQGSASYAADEIIVTAQRRAEVLTDVPISITAVTGETLVKRGIVNVTDLTRVAPGLEIPTYGNFVQFAIRGVSSQGAGLGDSSNVALYIDGVYQSSQQSQLQDLPDVQDIQVLKGPQGTLYGQNAVGGAIIVNTIAPSFTPKGRISASYGNYDDKHVRGYVTSGLSDTVAVLLSGSYQRRDGFRRDLINGGHDSGLKSWVVKGKVLFEPTDAVSFTLSGYYGKRRDTNPFTGAPLGGISAGYGAADHYGLNIPRGNSRSFALNVPVVGPLKNYGGSVSGKIDTGVGTLNTLTGYYQTFYHSIQDVDFTAVNIGNVDLPIKGKTFVQELNFTSNQFGRLRFTAGLFYMDKRERYGGDAAGRGQLFNLNFFGPSVDGGPWSPNAPTTAPTPPFTFLVIGGNSKMAKDSYAAYLEADYSLTDALTLTLGGRYSYERQKYATEKYFPAVPFQALVNSPVSFKKFTPHATLRYKFDDGTNIYASYSTGYKSGFLNATDHLSLPVQPETIKAYEVGYKGRPLPGVSFNLAAFHYEYKKLQVFIYDPAGGSRYENAASAKMDGVDGELTARLMPGLDFNIGASWLFKAKYSSYPSAAYLIPRADGYGNSNAVTDASGLRIIRAPKLQVSGSINFETETNAGGLDAFIGGTYNSGFKYDVVGVVRQPNYFLLDGEIGFAPAGVPGVRIVAWGRNLTDKDYFSSQLNSTIGNTVAYAAPRTFGGRIEFEF